MMTGMQARPMFRTAAVNGLGRMSHAPMRPRVMPMQGLGAADTGDRTVQLLLLFGVLGVTGYLVGKAVAPTQQSQQQYATAGAVSNIFLPVLGPLVVAGIALSKSK